MKLILTEDSVVLGLAFRLTPSVDTTLTVTEAVAVTVRVSVAVTLTVKVP